MKYTSCQPEPAYEDGTDGVPETSAYKIRTPGNYPEESVQHLERGESLKSRINPTCHLLALIGAHHIFHISRLRVKNSNSTPLFFSSHLVAIMCHIKVKFVCLGRKF